MVGLRRLLTVRCQDRLGFRVNEKRDQAIFSEDEEVVKAVITLLFVALQKGRESRC